MVWVAGLEANPYGLDPTPLQLLTPLKSENDRADDSTKASHPSSEPAAPRYPATSPCRFGLFAALGDDYSRDFSRCYAVLGSAHSRPIGRKRSNAGLDKNAAEHNAQ